MSSSIPALIIHDVTKRFHTPGKVHLPNPRNFKIRIEKPQTKMGLDHVSLTVPRGEIFGFLGPNGAGKTTLIKTIVGLLKPDHGTCQIVGHDGKAYDSQSREAKLKLGYLPERPYYHEFLSTSEFLHFHGRLLGLEDAYIEKKIPEVLFQVGLKATLDQKLRTFSKGMLQRIGFAQALLHDPDILVLDEPMSGLDPVGRREMRDLILQTASLGKTVFFSTHIIHDVEVICTNVAYIRDGILQGFGSIESLLGKTLRSMEVRFSYPEDANPTAVKALAGAKKVLDGWVIEVESDTNRLEYDVQEVLRRIMDGKGMVRSVVPRRSTLEDLFFTDTKSKPLAEESSA